MTYSKREKASSFHWLNGRHVLGQVNYTIIKSSSSSSIFSLFEFERQMKMNKQKSSCIVKIVSNWLTNDDMSVVFHWTVKHFAILYFRSMHHSFGSTDQCEYPNKSRWFHAPSKSINTIDHSLLDHHFAFRYIFAAVGHVFILIIFYSYSSRVSWRETFFTDKNQRKKHKRNDESFQSKMTFVESNFRRWTLINFNA